jgi:hypothetical protein
MEQTTTEQTTDTPVSEQQEPPSVNIQDLQVLRSCIQLASSRGAFKAEEMQTVGTAFNRLSAFLQYVENPQQADAPVTEAPTQGE